MERKTKQTKQNKKLKTKKLKTKETIKIKKSKYLVYFPGLTFYFSLIQTKGRN